ncbi:AIG2-like family-domain-containing protein [Mariannaea sp. PMI_226]|nr:AIG2-like family-domain-containing protein [Mariannaea sp. PMI_226]
MSGEYTAFFYGTLMAPEIFYSVCYGTSNPPQAIKDLHTFTPAVLDGYCRHRVRFADYPGIIPEKDHTVLGVYATGLTDANVYKLDYFEGSEYKREEVKVQLLPEQGNSSKKGESKETIVYVFIKPEALERKEWDFQHFRKEKMAFWTRGDWAYEQDPEDKAIV